MKVDADSPQVKIPPPFSLLVVLLSSFLVRAIAPMPLFGDSRRWIVGTVLVLLALSTILWCARLFRKLRTHIEPWKPTSALSTGGPYRFSRNPIYLSFLVMGLGLVCLVDNAPSLLLLVPQFFFLDRYVIRKEEAYLARKFGAEYESLRSRARRWL